MSITADQNILNMVQNCHQEIENPTQLRPWPEIQFDYKEEEIKKLLKPGYSSLRQKGHLGT